MNELKMKLKEAFPLLNGDIVKELISNTEFVNKDLQTMIDQSVAYVKNLFTVQAIDVYAEKLMTYTQEFLNKLDKLGVNWLICHRPTGLNFYSDELNNVFSEPFSIKTAFASGHIKQIKEEGKGKTFMFFGVSNFATTEHIIHGKLVRKSIFQELL